MFGFLQQSKELLVLLCFSVLLAPSSVPVHPLVELLCLGQVLLVDVYFVIGGCRSEASLFLWPIELELRLLPQRTLEQQ